jgi:hypothetical protein
MNPTKPGWWWADGIADPVWIAIDPDKGPTYGGMALDVAGLRLVAEVPGPAVSVAVAEWWRAVAAWEDVGGRTAPNGGADLAEAQAILDAEELVIDAFREAESWAEAEHPF